MSDADTDGDGATTGGLDSLLAFGVGALVVLVLLAGMVAVATGGIDLGLEPGSDDDRLFRETAASAGIEYETTDEPTAMVGGAFVGDYDRDGYPDVLLTGGDEPVLYHNDGGEFEAVDSFPTVEVGVKSALWVDYDGDGWEDLLLVPRIGEPVVLENDEGRFQRVDVGLDVTLDVGLGATAGDYDGDGCPDLFIYQAGDWRERVPVRGTDDGGGDDGDGTGADSGESDETDGDNGAPNYLYRGDCSSFERVTDAGIEGDRWSLAASFADVTGDGRPDVHVANDFNHDVVYRNQGDGTFERIELPESDRHGMASAVADVAGDDALDVFVTNIAFETPSQVRELQSDLDISNEGNTLFVYEDGRFVDRATALGVRRGGWGWAGTFADFDGDGDRDLVHATKHYVRDHPDEPGLTPVETWPAYYERVDDGFRRRNASALGFEATDGRGVAVLDYDADGDRDLLVADVDGDFALYENTGAGDDSIVVDVDRGPDVTALGAEVEVTTTDGRTIERTVTTRSNFLSQSTRTVHVGLDGAAVDRVRVVWPDGQSVVLDDVDGGDRLAVRYDGTVQPLPVRSVAVATVDRDGPPSEPTQPIDADPVRAVRRARAVTG